MSDNTKGQEGPTPDFIPGWYAPRAGNADPATREAVRIPETNDFFPITFLRSTEMVCIPKRPQRGFSIGNSQHSEMRLAVPPGYWIVRGPDGELYNWRDDDFKAKYVRSGQKWFPPVERAERIDGDPPGTVVEVPHDPPFARGDVVVAREGLTDVPPQMRGKVKKVKRRPLSWHANVRWNNGGRSHMIDCNSLELAAGPSPLDNPAFATAFAEGTLNEANRRDQLRDEIEGWQGTEPVEGTRRHLIREAIETVAIQARAQSTTAHFSQLLADAVESALLERTIEDEEEQDTGASKGDDAPTEGGFVPDEFDCAGVACQRLYERLTVDPIPNAAELARTIDILRHGVKH